jgi:hypothetical protein
LKRIGAVALVVATALGGGCGFADKKRLADRIREAPARMEAARTARGHIALSARVVRPKEVAAGFGRTLASDMSAPLDIDFTRRTAANAAQAVSGPILYVRRVRAADAGRSWVKLDLRDLYDDRDDLRADGYGANAISPLALVDLLRGALTGSVQRLGEEDIAGVATTHYRVNFAFDKAFDKAPDDLREGVEAALSVMGASYDGVVKGEVWLDTAGLPRRVAVTVPETKGRDQAIDLRYRLDLSDFGVATEIHLPKNRDIERVNSVNELYSAQGISR